ncbi:DUF485 domain-containing protein [Virgibacillus sp. SK37]|uniref:DUF485 domain-containing protein n=1 Tax=Virgibacillus sp. SK37 TaxID=403957 RepID=UPI0004D1249F|nr:DUF485 domain-containing protein [Virgibacillus sp. SK37]AIF44109.1 hypothetical protein X953_13835 [Virgibacillus sp. SK37]
MNFESGVKKSEGDQSSTVYERVSESRSFKKLIRERKKFIIPLTVFFLLFYFALPVLTSYSTILNSPAVGEISWAWVFAFAQFIMTWVLCIVYVKKSASFDKQSKRIIDEQLNEGGNTQ